MNKSLKTFRLINRTELEHLEKHFKKNIQLWNESYAMHPLSCKLSKNNNQHQLNGLAWCITDLNQPIALTIHRHHDVIKQSAFNKCSASFNDISETLFLSLLNQLFGTQSLQWQHSSNIDEYCYSGSPGLVLTLECGTQSTTLYIHPQWVLNNLPPQHNKSTPISSLDDALASHALPVHVELSPVPLLLTHLLKLKVGDVIKTDHLTTKPLLLKHDNKTICNVDIGQHFIQISRTS